MLRVALVPLLSAAAFQPAASCSRPSVRAPPRLASMSADLEQKLRDATRRASNSANAEARLRQMVAAAEKNAERMFLEKEAALASASDLREELDATRELAELEEAALREEVAELAAAAHGADAAAGGQQEPTSEGALRARVLALESERDALASSLYRAECAASDASADLAATSELCRQEEASLLETISELTARLRSKGAAGGDGAGAAPAADAAADRVSLLEGQVAALLDQVALGEVGSAELMTSRLEGERLKAQLAELEAKLGQK